jgi:hypothetical protein
MLEAHLDWLGRQYEFVSLDELGALLLSGPLSRPLAAITIDDGYRDAYETAFPLFKRKGIPAALFVVSGLVESSEVPVYDRLYYQLAQGYVRELRFPRVVAAALQHLDLAPMAAAEIGAAANAYDALQAVLSALSQDEVGRVLDIVEGEYPMAESVARSLRAVDWGMLRRMADGGMTIGSHTRNHAFLTREPAAVVAEELLESKRTIEAHLRRPVRHFAYPAGEFDAASVEAVDRAGYSFAYTICDHQDRTHPQLTIPRTILWEKACVDLGGRFSPALMRAHANGVFEMVSPRCRLAHSGGIERKVS